MTVSKKAKAQPVLATAETISMSAEEVAAQLGLHYNTVLDFAKRGIIPSIKTGGRVMFSRQALKDYFRWGSLAGLKNLYDHIGVDHKDFMMWVIASENYKDQVESDLVKVAKKATREMKQAYVDSRPPNPELIKTLEEILSKVEVFYPRQEVD